MFFPQNVDISINCQHSTFVNDSLVKNLTIFAPVPERVIQKIDSIRNILGVLIHIKD